MKPGDRLVCVFTSPKAQEEQFKEWPLHVTIVPWFRSDISTQEHAKHLQAALKSIKPFQVELGESAHFGHKKDKEVNLVRLPSPSLTIEKIVRQEIKANAAWLVDESTKHRRPFTPHVTVQKRIRLSEGDTFICDKLYVIEQLGGKKIVSGIIELNDV